MCSSEALDFNKWTSPQYITTKPGSSPRNISAWHTAYYILQILNSSKLSLGHTGHVCSFINRITDDSSVLYQEKDVLKLHTHIQYMTCCICQMYNKRAASFPTMQCVCCISSVMNEFYLIFDHFRKLPKVNSYHTRLDSENKQNTLKELYI